MTRPEMVAGKYVGVPFKERGCTPEGWDCWGLYHWIGRNDLGLELPSYVDVYASLVRYSREEIEKATASVVCGWRRILALEPGCLIAFDKRGDCGGADPHIYHVGMVLNDTDMIHVVENAVGGTVIEPFGSLLYRRFFAGFWVLK